MRLQTLCAIALSRAALVGGILAAGLVAAPATYADIAGFGDGTGFTLNSNTDAATAGVPVIGGGELQITSAANGQATSAFYDTKQGIEIFTAEFDYQMVAGSDPPADGMAFVLQNSAAAATALGGGGGARGYTGISDSVAVSFNLWQTRSDVDAGLNGAFGDRYPTAPLNLRDGNPVHAKIDYDSFTLSVELSDLVTGDTFNTSWDVDIADAVGDVDAYVGFSGGTGGANADQRVSNFTYGFTPIESLTWDGTANGNWDSATQWVGGNAGDIPNDSIRTIVNTNTVTTVADAAAYELTVANGGGVAVAQNTTLSVRRSIDAAAGTTVSLGSGATLDAPTGVVDSLATVGNATVRVNNNVAVNALDAAAGTFAKQGSGKLRLGNALDTIAAAADTIFRVEGGTLQTGGPNPLGDATAIELSGGMLTIDGGGVGTAGDITGFGDGTGFTLSGNAAAQAAGVPNISGGELQITSDVLSESANAFYNTPQDITAFRVEFDYALVGGTASPADEWSFIIQNNGAGAAAQGARGYTGLSDSVAVRVNLWDGHPDYGPSDVMLGTNGAYGVSESTLSSFDFRSGDTIHMTVKYDGLVMDVDFEDLVTGATLNKSYPVDIPGVVGADTAYLGFGGGTGGLTADQRIGNFSNAFDAYPIEQQNTSVLVTGDSTLDAQTATAARFGHLTITGGVLTTSGARKGGISFTGTTIDAAATAVGFDPVVPTTYGPIDAGNAPVTISKEGPGTWVLDVNPTNLSNEASWRVADGTLELQSSDPIGGLPVTVAGGTLSMVGGEKLNGAPVTLAGGTLLVSDGGGGIPGDILGFGDGTGWTVNANAGAQGAGVPHFNTPGTLQVTTDGNDQNISAFYDTPQDVTAFRAEFDYQVVDLVGNPADGIAFVVQNSGLDALGTGGGGRGYLNMGTSAAVLFDIYTNDDGRGLDFGTGGSYGATVPTGSVDLVSGNVIHTVVAYDGHTVTLDLEDLSTGATFSTSYDVDIPAAVGGNTAYLGFTGATGGANANQIISNFSNAFTSVPINTAGIDLTVTETSTLDAATHTAAPFGSLLMKHGSLTTTGAFLGGISFTSTTIDPAATAVGFDPQAPTDYGVIDAGNAPVTIAKTGSSTWVLDTAPLNLAAEAGWKVEGGTLELQGLDPIGGLPIEVAGGVLSMVGGEQLNGAPVTLSGGTMIIEAGGMAIGEIDGFGDGTGWTINANTDAQAAGVPGFDGNGALQITSAANSQATSVFYSTPQDVAAFRAEFDYQLISGSDPPADGVALVFQNNAAGVNALGGGGGSRGYGGLANSAAMALNLWNTRSDVDEGLNGAFGSRLPTSPVNLRSGNVIHAIVDYDGVNVTVGLEDMTTGDTSTVSYAADIPGAVGGPAAYVGFSGGTGGANADQRISNFSMSYAFDTIELQDVDLLVTEDSALAVTTHSGANFGALTMTNGVLATSGAFLDGITFQGTTIDAGATAVGFNPSGPLDLGVINANSAAATIIKSGPGDLVLSAENLGLDNATFEVQGGRLIGVPAAAPQTVVSPFGPADFRLAGGELVLAGRTTGEDVAYDRAVTVVADSALTAGAGGAGASGPVTVTVGGANGVTLDGGTLSLGSTDGYTLNVAGSIGGTGVVDVARGNVTLAAGGGADSLTLSGGTLVTGADLNVVTMTIPAAGGTANTGANQVTVSDRLTIDTTDYTIDPDNTLDVTGSDVGAAANVVVSGGTLTVDAGISDTGGLILGFGDGSQFTLNGNSVASGAGVPNISDGVLQISSEVNSQSATAFFSTPQDVTAFSLEFDYQNVSGPTPVPADEWSFIIQNEGLNAEHNRRGYQGITQSVGIRVNIYQVTDMYLGVNGSLLTGESTLPELDFRNGNTVHFSLSYVDELLEVAMEDLVTGETLIKTYDVDIPAEVGSDTAYFGFGAGTGGLNADQRISNFTNAFTPNPIDQETTSFTVTADSTIELTGLQDAVLGNLAVQSGVAVTLTGAAAGLNDVTSGDTASIDGVLLLRGVLSPGNVAGPGIGILTINGELEFEDDGSYLCELSGADNDQIVIAADAFLGGTLELRAIGQLEAVGDHTRTIVTAVGEEGAVSMTFDDEPAAGDHLGYGVFHQGVTYDPNETSVEVDVFQALAGDTNGDRQVDNGDLQEILGAGSFGSPGEWDWTQGDFNGDGAVNNGDLQLILATGQFGQGTYTAIGAGAVAVPEPATMVLLGGGLLGLLVVAIRRRRAS